MEIGNSLSAAQFIAALSSLSNANKQPQLALDLIERSVATSQVAGAAQSSAAPGTETIAPSLSPGAVGSVIDIHA